MAAENLPLSGKYLTTASGFRAPPCGVTSNCSGARSARYFERYMKRNVAIKLMIVTNQPAVRVRGGRSRRVGTKLKLQKFESHRFTPQIQVLQVGSLCPPHQFTAAEWQQIGNMVHVIHRPSPRTLPLIQILPHDLC